MHEKDNAATWLDVLLITLVLLMAVFFLAYITGMGLPWEAPNFLLSQLREGGFAAQIEKDLMVLRSGPLGAVPKGSWSIFGMAMLSGTSFAKSMTH